MSASTALIAEAMPPVNGIPVREGIDVTVMITPERFSTIRRAAGRAVRKYELVVGHERELAPVIEHRGVDKRYS